MTFRTCADILETWAPIHFAENYDNVGLIVGEYSTEITGILINLDLTDEVLEEAKAKNCNLIVTHHPIWFGSRKRLNGEDYVSKLILKAIRYNIGLYAIHTNLDNISSGVNFKIAQKLNLSDTQFLSTKPNGVTGSGIIGFLPQPLTKRVFLQTLRDTFHSRGIRYADTHLEMIHKVAVCGGSGSFLIEEAIRQEADAFVTADITYHKFFDSEKQLLYADIGHYESEQFTSELIFAFLTENFTNFVVCISEINTNPVQYFI